MDGVLLSAGRELAPARLDLARFDTAPALPLDADVFRRNLDAFVALDPALAAQTAATPLPASWQPVRGLDEFPTFRIPSGSVTGGPDVAWRCGTAAPQVRAAALFADYRWKSANPALPIMGSGAELTLLLARLPRHAAIYVFVEDALALSAVLRLLDLAPALRAGRCILVPPLDPAQFLHAHLSEHPGLLPPGHVLRMTGVEPARTEFVRSLCEDAGREANRVRGVRIAALADGIAETHQTCRPDGRLALVDFSDGDREIPLEIRAASVRLGWACETIELDGPRSVHPVAPFARLAEFKPSLTLFAGSSRAALPAALPGHACDWYLSAREVPATLDPRVSVAAASPTIRTAIQKAGAPENSIVNLYWAVDDLVSAEPPITGSTDTRATRSASALLIASKVDCRPDVCGVEQPMHRRLWEQMRRVIVNRWETAAAVAPERVLALAEQALRAPLTDSDARAMFLRAVERALIPATIAERICNAAGSVGIGVLASHGGTRRWETQITSSLTMAPPHSLPVAPAQRPEPPCAVIVSWLADPLIPELLQAAMDAWPILMFAPDRSALTRGLGGVLVPGEHLTTFSTSAELQQALRQARAGDAALRERAAAARSHLLSNHTWRHRLRALAGTIPGASPS